MSVGDDATIGAILVDSTGRTLYTAEQEADGTVCEAGCSICMPLTVSEGEAPTAAGGRRR